MRFSWKKNLTYVLLFFVIIHCQKIAAQVNVLTQHNDLKRTGWNNKETILTQENVSSGHFGQLFSRAVDDLMYAQPLIVSNLQIKSGIYNIVFTATVNNSVYAFDADDPLNDEPFWQVNLTYEGYRPPHNTDLEDSCRNYIGNIGIVGTPVIDLNTNTIYLVARSVSQDGKNYVQYLHALDLITGAEKPGSPAYITASVPSYSPGNVDGIVTFDAKIQNQRAGLLLYDNTVFICWASQCDNGQYHGWVMGYDATTLGQKYVYNATRRGGLAAGIWMSGQAPAVDDEGYIYLTTGNGTVGASDENNPNDTTNRGESLLKLTTASGAIKIADFFTPNDWEYLEANDLDYGSDGVLLIPGTHLSLSGSKESYLYVIDNNNMGGVTADNSNVVQLLNINAQSNVYPNHLHGTPVYFKNETGNEYIYAWAESGLLKQIPFNRSTMRFDDQLVIEGNTLLDEGMPGAMFAVSSNGSQSKTGILWASHPISGDAVKEIVPGMIQAFDANDVTHELWNSTLNAERDSIGRFAKFVCPTVANGKVYMATFSNRLAVYGLNPASYSSCKPPASPWKTGDIGYVNYTGDACDDNGTVTLHASGDSIGNNTDAFYAVYRDFNANSSGEIKAKVISVQNTNPLAKCGVMFRKNLDPGSPNVFMALTPANGRIFQNRLLQSGETYSKIIDSVSTMHYWLKLVKSGDKYIGYTSVNGESWDVADSVNISLGTYPYAMVAYSANDNNITGTAVIDSISVLNYSTLQFGLGTLTAKNINDEFAELKWTSANEQDGDVFYVERSTDKFFFNSLAVLNSSPGTGLHNYLFNDNNITGGKYYYRIQQRSKTGELKYSNVASLSFNTYILDVYPNPVNSQMFIRYIDYMGEGDPVSIQLLSNLGQLVYSYNTAIPFNSKTIIMNIPGTIKNGLYLLRVVNSKGQVRGKKILVMR